jgi:hypothetical protein
VAVAVLADIEEREVERGGGLVLDLVVGDIGARAQDDLGDGVGAVDIAGKAGMGFHDRRLAARARQHDRPWVGHNGRATGLGEEHELDRGLNNHTGGERDEGAVAAEGRVQRLEGMLERREAAREDRLETLVSRGQHRRQVGDPGAARQLFDAGELGGEEAVDEDQTGAAQTDAEAVERHPCVLVAEPRQRPLEGHRQHRFEARVAPVLVLAGREAVRAYPVRSGPPHLGKPHGTIAFGLEQRQAGARRDGNTGHKVTTGGHGLAAPDVNGPRCTWSRST